MAAVTYPAMISLLAVIGMRFGEAIALDVTDFDDQTETVIVRAGKFGKSRLLPVHPTTADGLRQYLAHRRDLLRAKDLADRGVLFVSAVGTLLDHSSAQKNWRKIRDMAGLTPRSATCRPRLHDLRHSFAVATLLDWYRRGGRTPAVSSMVRPALQPAVGVGRHQHHLTIRLHAAERQRVCGAKRPATDSAIVGRCRRAALRATPWAEQGAGLKYKARLILEMAQRETSVS